MPEYCSEEMACVRDNIGKKGIKDWLTFIDDPAPKLIYHKNFQVILVHKHVNANRRQCRKLGLSRQMATNSKTNLARFLFRRTFVPKRGRAVKRVAELGGVVPAQSARFAPAASRSRGGTSGVSIKRAARSAISRRSAARSRASSGAASATPRAAASRRRA